MKNFNKKLFVLIFLGFLFLFPLVKVAYGQGSGIPPVAPDTCNKGIVTCCEGPNCNFGELMKAVQKVVTFAIKFGLGFSVVVIAYAGWIYLTSGGQPGERKKANDMFVSVAWGIFFLLAAWLIVNLIMSTLVGPTPANLISNTTPPSSTSQ